jgi:hypothetical protein
MTRTFARSSTPLTMVLLAAVGSAAAVRASEVRALRLSFQSPVFVVDGQKPIGGVDSPGDIKKLADGRTVELSYAPIRLGDESALEVKVLLQMSGEGSVPINRKWARFRLVGAPGPRLLKEVILDRIDAKGKKVWTHGSGAPGRDSPMLLEGPQSHPVFMPGVFLGVEYPVASTRYEDGKIVLAHRPGLRMQPGVWYETRKAVEGMTDTGDEVRSFQRYIESHRPTPHGCHINYNSWWTTQILFTETEIVDR